MLISSAEAENNAVLSAAYELAAAARTAPKACGRDHLETVIITGTDKDALAEKMREMAAAGDSIFLRDADNIDKSAAVVAIGVKEQVRGLGEGCNLCHQGGCAGCAKSGAVCMLDPIDLGIAIGSAASKAADLRMDNRVYYTAGKAVIALNFLPGCTAAFAIALSVSGKSPFFDRYDPVRCRK